MLNPKVFNNKKNILRIMIKVKAKGYKRASKMRSIAEASNKPQAEETRGGEIEL